MIILNMALYYQSSENICRGFMHLRAHGRIEKHAIDMQNEASARVSDSLKFNGSVSSGIVATFSVAGDQVSFIHVRHRTQQ